MKKFTALLLAVVMVLALCGVAEAAPKKEVSDEDFHIDIKFSNVFNPKEWNYKASQMLADMITEKTEGHVSVTYYGTNELDCYADSVTQAVNGALWMGLEEPSLFADYVGDAAMVIAPMLYSTNEEYNYVMDSDFVKDLCAKLAEQNIHILDTHYSFGFRSVCSNLDVTTPEDLKGHQFRATSSALFAKTLECLGATPVVMGFTDCLAAIQQGVVEGFEGSVSTLAGAGEPYELVKKVALTNHLIATRWLFMPEDVWQTIPEKYQKIIEECAYECGMWEQTSCEEDEAVQIKKMSEEDGVTWNEVDLDAFSAAMVPVIDWIVDEYGSTYEAYDQLCALVAEFRANNK
ncbi:MAG: TRAP transporter substrate-binding protein DctP [Eubacteriales bacterium]|nr:TRAP transporter substrate-binding protein DctP [Eubacteriales bacterium]